MPLQKAYLAPIFLIGALIAALPCALARPEVVQTVTGFNRPVSADFSENGSMLYVVNRARGEVGVTRHEGSVSSMSVDKSGLVGKPNHRFVTRLTGPTDLAVSPVAFGDIPRGSLFVVTGTPLIQNESGRIAKDATGVFIGIVVIDAASGQELKRIDLSPGAATKLQGDTPLISPDAIEFDKKGNLYIGDTGIGGHLFSPRVQGKWKIWRIDRNGVMSMVSGKSPQESQPIGVSSLPGAMTYHPASDTLYFITNHTQGPPSGSVFRVASENLVGLGTMQTIVRELPALSGLQITPKGRVLMTSSSGELLLPRGRKAARELRFRPQKNFITPGKFDLLVLSSGELLLAVPEEGSDAGVNKGQSMQMTTLPAGF